MLDTKVNRVCSCGLLGSKAEKPERCGASESQTSKFGRYSNTVRGLLNKAVDEIESAANVEEMMMRDSREGWDLFRRRNARNDRVLDMSKSKAQFNVSCH
jgi:hypothetical protein